MDKHMRATLEPSTELLDSVIASGELIAYLKKNKNEAVIKSLITTCALRFAFCRDVEDREEMWSKITSDKYRYYYCFLIKDRPEIGGEIGSYPWLFFYIRDCKILKKANGSISLNEYKRQLRAHGYSGEALKGVNYATDIGPE